MRASGKQVVAFDRGHLSPQDRPQGKGAKAIPAGRLRPRSLAGATILQLVPAMRDDPAGHAAVDMALAMVQSGARAIVAGEGGPLVGELRTLGGEWLPMASDSPLQIRSNRRKIAQLIASERIDVVHAQCASAAWSAIAATRCQPVFLVTSFPDQIAGYSFVGNWYNGSLARGGRVIAPSSYVSRAMIERYRIPAERITVIPRAVETAGFSPAAVSSERIAAIRRKWGILPHIRVVLVPGRLAPWNGQMSVIDAARLLIGAGDRNLIFVFAGDDRGQPRYRAKLRRRAAVHGIDTLCRFVGNCPDMPAAVAAADVVVVPSLEAPLTGRAVAVETVLKPDPTAYEALGARARQFAEFMFSPQSVAEAIRGVYTSLLARDA